MLKKCNQDSIYPYLKQLQVHDFCFDVFRVALLFRQFEVKYPRQHRLKLSQNKKSVTSFFKHIVFYRSLHSYLKP